MNRQEHLQVKYNAGQFNTFIRMALDGEAYNQNGTAIIQMLDSGLLPGSAQAGSRSVPVARSLTQTPCFRWGRVKETGLLLFGKGRQRH